MDDPLLEAVLKSDDNASVRTLEDGSIELLTDLDLSAYEEARPLGQVLHENLIDTELLQNEALNRPARIPVRVVRYIFAGNAMFSATCMTLSYIVYYFLSFDVVGSAAVFVLVASLVCMGVFYSLLAVLFLRTAAVKLGHSALFFALIGCFATSAIFAVGALSSVAGNITPMQAATVCFAQSLAVYGYALTSPQHMDPLHAVVYMIIAAMGVWFIGLYGFIVQQAWISSGLLFFWGALTSFYYSAQIHFASRYNISHADMTRALARFYLDPLLWTLDALPCCAPTLISVANL